MYPNPISAIEHCRFTIADTSNVQIILYDIKGNEVANICDDILKPGKYQFLLFNNDKIKINSGIYIVVLEAGTIETIVRRKMKFRSELIVMYIK